MSILGLPVNKSFLILKFFKHDLQSSTQQAKFNGC